MDEAFCSTQMWVQAWHIPIQWLSAETGWKIRKIFNRCFNIIILENESKDGRYVKLLIEVDLSKPLVRGTKIRLEGENKMGNV